MSTSRSKTQDIYIGIEEATHLHYRGVGLSLLGFSRGSLVFHELAQTGASRNSGAIFVSCLVQAGFRLVKRAACEARLR